MRKIASLLSVLMLVCTLAFGQTRTVSGTVRDANGNAVPFATITVVGTNTATQADANGAFSLSNVANNARLSISSTGFTSQTISASGNLSSITLARGGDQLSEVVVTALGIRKRPKELGYSTASVRAEQITAANNPNLASALSGKLTGLVVTNVNSSVQSNTRVVLRGNRSLTGNNEALVVLDGVPVPSNTLSYLNPNDVENVSVLKGGQAATLYGSEGANGVLVVTTKKGARGRTQVSVTSSATFDEVSFLPKFQNRFGSGSGYGYDPTQNYRTYENQSYGDEYDGSIRPLGRTAESGDAYLLPYSALKNEKRKVWDIGHVLQNDIAVSGGDDRSSFYLSFQDAKTNGVVPGDERRRDGIRFNAGRTYGKFRANFQSSYTQDNFDRTNSDFYFFVINAAANVPLTKLRDWRTNQFANPNGYYNDYYNNPWFELDNNRWVGRNNFFNGSVDLNFAPTKWFSATYRVGLANSNSQEKITTGQFIYSDYAKFDATVPEGFPGGGSGIFRAKDILGGVTDRTFSGDADKPGNRINSDFILTFNKDFNQFSTNLTLGNNIQQKRYYFLSVNSNSIVIPDLYNIGNRTGELGGSQASSLQRKYGFYGDGQVGFRDFLFLHGSVRRDATSLFYSDTRDKSDYQYWYYGADVSFIVSDAIPSLKSDFFNYLKLRAGFNKNANDNINPYSLNLNYGLGAGFPFGSLAGTTTGNTIPSPTLIPERVKSYEAGAEFNLLRNRIGVDLSYYYQVSEGQIINITVPRPTGFSNALINAGRLDNWGYEAEVKIQAIKSQNVSWDVNFNYSYNDNKVKSLYGDLDRISLNNNFTESGGVITAQLVAELNQPFPLLQTTYFARDSLSRIIVDPTTGYPSNASDYMSHGRTTPKHDLGITSRIAYKSFALSATAEYRGGFYVFHGLGSSMTFTGVADITAQYGRENFVLPNSSYDDGSGKYVGNTNIPVADGHYYFWDQLYKFAGENYVTKGDFWKLREVNLTYSLPTAILRRAKVIKGASLSLIGRNLVTLVPKDNLYTDTEFANTTGNALGINNTLNTPPVRSYGATLNLTF